MKWFMHKAIHCSFVVIEKSYKQHNCATEGDWVNNYDIFMQWKTMNIWKNEDAVYILILNGLQFYLLG